MLLSSSVSVFNVISRGTTLFTFSFIRRNLTKAHLDPKSWTHFRASSCDWPISTARAPISARRGRPPCQFLRGPRTPRTSLSTFFFRYGQHSAPRCHHPRALRRRADKWRILTLLNYVVVIGHGGDTMGNPALCNATASVSGPLVKKMREVKRKRSMLQFSSCSSKEMPTCS